MQSQDKVEMGTVDHTEDLRSYAMKGKDKSSSKDNHIPNLTLSASSSNINIVRIGLQASHRR
jgi:hypothetical protein